MDILTEYKKLQPISLEDFVQKTGIGRRQIIREFGSFTNLKSKAIDTPNKAAMPFQAEDVIQVTGAGVRTLEELVEFCAIDLKEWEATKFSPSVWDNKVSVKGEFKRRVEEKNVADLLSFFTAEAEKHAPKTFKYERPRQSGKLLVLQLSDLHLGKSADHGETGWGSYNFEIAKKYYRDAVDELIKSTPPDEISTVLLVVGSDLIHFENRKVETTSGTKIEGEGTWYKVYNEACSLMAEVIEKLAGQFKVEIVCIYGNHARLSEYALGSYTKAYFRFHPNVNVNNEPKSKKYFGFGKSLIGFAHGDGMKVADLPMVMMRENQEIIGNYEELVFLTGHTHTDRTVDIKGVKVIVCPALCSADGFHNDNNWVGGRQAGQALLFNRHGLQAVLYSRRPEKVKN